VRFLTTLSKRSVAVGVALGACALSVPAAVAASPTGVSPTGVSPTGTWVARVLPSTAPLSVPSFLLDEGIVVGSDATTEIYGQGRPWTWSPAAGRRPLRLGGADWALVSAAPGPRGIVGTTYRPDPNGVLSSTAVRWVDGRPVPLLPDATSSTAAETANRRGDAVVAQGPSNGSGTTSLLVRGEPPVPLPLFSGRQVGRSMNAARQIVISSLGPGTIGPVSFGVLQDGQLAELGINGFRDFPACVGAITESGYVAGSRFAQLGDLRREAVRWRAGVRTVLPADGLSASVPCSQHPVNEAGQVVGTLSVVPTRPGEPVPEGPPTRTVVWQDSGFVVLAVDSAAETVRPVAINDRGAVLALVTPAGGAARPAVYSGGTRHLLPVPAGLTNVSALDINERNQVVGSGTRTVGGETRTVTVFWAPTSS
jgi:hypothetical protein